MNNVNDLLTRINDRYSRFSKGQKLLATYITDEYKKAAFFTAAKLGETVGVSESTVVRFATSLGYKGYPEFQQALEELVQEKLDKPVTKLENFTQVDDNHILNSVLSADSNAITKTLNEIDQEIFLLAADLIHEAKNVYIIGLRSCQGLASYLAFYLNLIHGNVHLISTNSSSEIFEQLLRIGKNDLVIGISFPRYSLRTLKALEYANNHKARVITITDSIHSPLNLYSSCNLVANVCVSSIVESLVAPMSLINALIVALVNKNSNKVIRTLDELERTWDDYMVYGKDEIDLLEDSVKMRYYKPEND